MDIARENDRGPNDAADNRPEVRHAMIVLQRILRSKRPEDLYLQERLISAARVAQAVSNSETALVSGRPADGVFRLASRIIRIFLTRDRHDT